MSPVDGFYAAFLTGASGTSVGVFVFRDQVLAGADAGGGRYDGDYAETADGKYIEGSVRFLLSPGRPSITGASALEEPLVVEVPFKLPVDIDSSDFHRIETPIGPINARFEKIRGS